MEETKNIKKFSLDDEPNISKDDFDKIMLLLSKNHSTNLLTLSFCKIFILKVLDITIVNVIDANFILKLESFINLQELDLGLVPDGILFEKLKIEEIKLFWSSLKKLENLTSLNMCKKIYHYLFRL